RRLLCCVLRTRQQRVGAARRVVLRAAEACDLLGAAVHDPLPVVDLAGKLGVLRAARLLGSGLGLVLRSGDATQAFAAAAQFDVGLQSELLQLAAHDRSVGDVVGQCADSLGATQLTKIGETDGDGASKDSLIVSGSGSGLATGPSQ